MWHSLAFVAQSRRLNEKMFVEFALSDQERYGIVVERGVAEVNTWHVDALVSDFNASREGNPL
ncbi:MAG: hypothetical protein HND43_10475 [Armatimonadetes bacterium]|jgi:hypothetical protein|nr:hypothetical protein [Armatimonadota bacterium]NOG39799.1 hypothetical protein [Armatimonadota bacterium]